MRKGTLSILAALVMVTSAFMGLMAITPAEGSDGAIQMVETEDEEMYKTRISHNGHFTENKGQWTRSGFEYFANSDIGGLGFSDEGVFIDIVDNIEGGDEDEPMIYTGQVLKLSFDGSGDLDPVGQSEIVTKYHYLIGERSSWVRHVPNYAEVLYEDVWNGIDLKYRFEDESLKYDFIISPKTDPTKIRVSIDGQEDLRIEDRALVIEVNEDTVIRDSGLEAFYLDNPKQKIGVQFQLVDDNTYTFKLDHYDNSRSIVIDPLYFSTFMGGGGYDYAYGTSSDGANNYYLAGYTAQGTPEFPTTTGAYAEKRPGGYDGFVSKFDHSGSALIWSTFIGGKGTDYGRSIDVDENGYAYFAGYTYYSSSGIYPTTANAYQTKFTYNYVYEGFVTKFTTDGSDLVYSTLIGGAYYDYIQSIVVDSQGSAYITGYSYFYSTYSNRYGDYPTTSGTFMSTRPTTSNQYDAFATKFNSAGTALVWSTFIGGTSTDYGYAIDVDSSYNAYVGGYTTSSNFKLLNAFDSTYQSYEAFLTKLDSFGAGVFSTYLGGSSYDYGRGVAVDDDGNAYLGGYTGSSQYTFPVTPGAFDTTYNGYEWFVAKFSKSGTSLDYCTYIGGSSSDYCGYDNLDVTSNGEAWISGYVFSTNFPVTSGAYQSSHRGGSYDGAVANVSIDGSSLGYASYFGGTSTDYFYGAVNLDKNNNALLCGYTYSSNFPTTKGAYQEKWIGTSNDAFFIKVGNPFADSEPPKIVDNSAAVGYASRDYDLDATVTDNVGILEVTVEYWHGTGAHVNHSFDPWGPYERTIDMPDSLDDLYYFFSARDSTGKWASTPTKTIKVYDIDAPKLTSLNTPAGYTGDPFFFSLGITDNIDGPNIASASIIWTYNYDWANARSPTLTYDPNSQLWNSSTFNVQMNSLDPITFNFTAKDSTGNELTQGPFVVLVLDNDAPTISSDSTLLATTTGDPHNFTVKADDNIHDPWPLAFLDLEYLGGNKYKNLPMDHDGSGGYYLVKNIDHILPSLTYSIRVVDTGGYSDTSGGLITITDNDPPEIFSDMSQGIARAGQEDYSFRVMVTDNIQLTDVHLEYWFSFDTAVRDVVMNTLSPDYYYHLIDLPLESGKLHYKYWTVDTPAGLRTDTAVVDVVILDTNLPDIADIVYEPTATTGEPYEMSVTVTDDVDLSYVRMHYNFGDDLPEIMVGDQSGDTFSFGLDIPHDLTPLYFWFEASDLNSNIRASDLYMVTILDNDMPEFMGDTSDTSGTTGDTVMLSVQVGDNIGIDSVNVDYIMPGGEWTSIGMMTEDMETFHYEVELLNDVIGDFSYYFTVYDTSMNMVQAAQVDFEVTDDELPVAMIVGPDSAYQFETVFFMATGSGDNVGIISYVWEINGESFSGTEVNYTFDTVGEYTIELKVSDGVNPTISYSYNITILDAEDPIIVLDIAEEYGNHEIFSADASGSTDNVGVTTFNWLLILPDQKKITGSDALFEYDLEGLLGEATLYLSIADSMGNGDSAVYMFTIFDLSAPVVTAPEDITVLEGTYLTFRDDTSHDNIGVVDWSWHISFGDVQETIEGDTMGFLFQDDGVYNITLTAFDSHGNSASDFFYVTVIEEALDTDTDGDGMPDWWEEEVGLDKEVDDADRDNDRDFLTNIREFQLGTNPKNDDSDDDGLPDNFEHKYAHDEGKSDIVNGVPRWMDDFKATDDTDGDGDDNLAEYLEGNRDPLVEDAPEKETDNTTLYLIIALIVIILVAIIIVAAIILFGKVKTVEEDFPEGQYPHLYKNVEAPAPESPPVENI